MKGPILLRSRFPTRLVVVIQTIPGELTGCAVPRDYFALLIHAHGHVFQGDLQHRVGPGGIDVGPRDAGGSGEETVVFFGRLNDQIDSAFKDYYRLYTIDRLYVK